ncbi:MAG: ankyrin repeat domain-containing protein, partial [Desulfobacterales bacterium]
MKTGNNRKYLLIFSGVLLAYQYLGLVIDGNIPYTQIKISSQANISIALTILIFFFGSQYSFYWFKQKKEERSLFEFASSIPIGLIAIVPICYSYLKKFGIDWKVIVSTILILFLGSLLAVAADFIIAIIFSLRTPEEMKKMGLGKIPSASKAFIRCLLFLIPLCISVFFFLVTYSYILPTPLKNYWHVIFLTPTFLWNFENFINLLLCLGPSKVRKKALNNLHIFRRAMDLHEMHYQYIGIEKFKDHELPAICQFARDGKLAEVQELLSIGIDPNSQDSRGWCPLMWATAEGHVDIVEFLLKHGADPNIINYLGRSAIMYASNYGFYEIAKALIEKGAILNPS